MKESKTSDPEPSQPKNVKARRVGESFAGHTGVDAFVESTLADPTPTLLALCSGKRSASPALESLLSAAAAASIEAGAELDWKALRGALFSLAREGRHEILAAILTAERASDLKAKAIAGLEEDEKGMTLLSSACMCAKPECVRLLLSLGADPEGRTQGHWREGWKALHYAAQNEQDKRAAAECAKALLEAGADPGRKTTFWGRPQTAFETALERGNERVARLLVKAGADPNFKNEEGCCALALAARGGHKGVLSELLAQGARVDEPDKDGHTALLLACKAGSAQIVRKLLDAGARLECETKWGATSAREVVEKSGGGVVEMRVVSKLLEMLDKEPSRREAEALASSTPEPEVQDSGALLRKLRI